MRRISIPLMTLVFLMLGLLLCFAKAPAKEGGKNANGGYAGTEVCQTCHAQVYDALAKTAMGTLFLKHPRTAEEKLGCETCHGSATEHVSSGGKSFAGMVLFKKGTATPASVRNEACFKCHQKRDRLFWAGSPHDVQGVACTTCHAVHTGPGAASRHQLVNVTVEDTCNTCHKEQVKAELRFSHHPAREGKMNCASCHNPHGTTAPKLIREISTKELCFKCHAQYRGPFVWQHPPVMEDCGNCHQPHGSAYPALLKSPPVRLCRECHISFHNLNFQPGGIKPRVNQMMGSGCVNCHKNIHGSNSFNNGQLFFR